MYPYRYCVSLRLRHPSIDPQSITHSLGEVPEHSSSRYSPHQSEGRSARRSPTRDLLDGETASGALAHDEERGLEDFLWSAIDRLQSKSIFLDEFVQCGGSA